MNIFDYEKIPEHLMRRIKMYVDHGQNLGGFLYAIFTNDLFKAVGKADDINMPLIQIYVAYIVNEVPYNCHGSKEIVDLWIEKKQNESKNLGESE